MTENSQNPNTVTVSSGFGRTSRRTGNRIDRYAERLWITRQSVTFPLNPVCMMLSGLRTYYVRCTLVGAVYLLLHYNIVQERWVPLGIVAGFVLWELVVGAYLWQSRQIPKFDLMLRIFIALPALVMAYFQIFQGFCTYVTY